MGLLLMRRLGLWKRLRAAPLSRTQLLGSRIVASALISLIVFVVIYAVAIAAFGVRVLGSPLGFALLTATFGLLVAALGRTPEATRGLAILATLLMVMLVPSQVFAGAHRVDDPARCNGFAARLAGAVALRLAVEDEQVVAQFDAVAGQADDALDQARAADR